MDLSLYKLSVKDRRFNVCVNYHDTVLRFFKYAYSCLVSPKLFDV